MHLVFIFRVKRKIGARACPRRLISGDKEKMAGQNRRIPLNVCEYLDSPTHCSAMGAPDAAFGQSLPLKVFIRGLRLPKNATAFFGLTTMNCPCGKTTENYKLNLCPLFKLQTL